jgi:rhodanese-related sulfurtransferase
MALKIDKPLVSADWLFSNLEDKNLIILDATIPKVTSKIDDIVDEKEQIKNAIFFDIKNTFSDQKSALPNTALLPKEFEEEVQKLGVKKESCIVVYDDLGIYSSPRVWWLFHLMGFTNIAIVDGGFPEWKLKNTPGLLRECPGKNKKKGVNMLTLKFVEDFTDVPGGRYKKESDYSGEAFRKDILIPKIKEAIDTDVKLLIDLDGAYGYQPSFLDESFGKISQYFNTNKILKTLVFKSEDQKHLPDKIIKMIKGDM